MKIGFDSRVIAYHNGSGLFTYSYNIMKELIKLDLQNEYYAFDINSKKKRMKINNIDEIKVLRSEDFWYNMYNSNWKFTNIDVDIFFNMINGIGIPNKGYKKLYITIHDLIPYIYPESCDKEHLRYVLRNTPDFIYKADKIFTVSNNSKNDIIRYFNVPESKIVVTYLAANECYMVMNKVNSNRYIKHKYGIDNNYILYVGGFSERKNIITLINAFEILIRKHKKKVKLIILGKESRTYDMLSNRIKELNIQNDVIFPGYICDNDMPYFYNSSLMLVYPSLYEGFGLPILEAMQCGTPVITANNSSISEIFQDTAILVDSMDESKYAEKMNELISNNKLRRRIIEMGLIKSKQFSWNNTANIIINEIKN